VQGGEAAWQAGGIWVLLLLHAACGAMGGEMGQEKRWGMSGDGPMGHAVSKWRMLNGWRIV